METLKKILLLSFFVTLVNCTKKDSVSELYPLKETFRVNLRSEPQSLDWNYVADGIANEVLLNITEGLVRYDVYDPEMKLLPTLALHWEPKDHARKWEFTIREGVRWTDGVPFTPQQILDGFERSLNPKTASLYAYVLFAIKNAREYSLGKLTDFTKVGIKLIKPNVVQFELTKPVAFFPYVLTLPVAFPIRKDVIEKHKEKWTEAANIQTLGPYKLKSWEHDKMIVLERNENYYGPPAKTKNIVMHIIEEATTALNLFESKKLDFIHAFPMTDYQRLKDTAEFRTQATPTMYFYGFNTKLKPYDDVRIRRALAHAIDRCQIIKAVGNGVIETKSWIPEGFLARNANIGLDFDLQKARELLAEAGYSKKALPKISIFYYTSEVSQKIGESVQAQLKNNLGIEVELKQQEWKVYLDQLRQQTLSIHYEGWLADYLDPDSYMTLMTKDSENNHTHWSNPRYDKLVEMAASELDSKVRIKLYDEAQKILLEEDVAAIPLLVYSRNSLVSQEVDRVPLNNMEIYRYDQVELKRK